ncbi:MAG: hypothetical protein PHF97_01705 [Bacteroidales bacterium]|nr:hypothetical protein [Bacteroidales bacterium]
MKRFIIIFISIFTCCYVQAQYTGQLTTTPQSLIFETNNTFDVVKFNSDCVFTDSIGKPQIPVKILRYVLPVDATVTGVQVNNYSKVELSGTYT